MSRLIPSRLQAHPLPAKTLGLEALSPPASGVDLPGRLPTAHGLLFSEQPPRELDRRGRREEPRPRRESSVLFYEGGGVRVTDTYIETAEGRFLLRDTQSVERVETLAYPAGKVAAVCSAVEFGLAAALAAHTVPWSWCAAGWSTPRPSPSPS